jgi:Putative papain-like cysteine peptidase (DUF1796)
VELREIRKSYDVVVSLGGACEVAAQIRRKSLRVFSGPLDWFIFLPIPKLIEALKSNFEGFMDLTNLQVQGKHDDNYAVRDTKYDCLSLHDFPVSKNSEKELRTYGEFKKKIDRRISRLYQKMGEGKSILFIRLYGGHDEITELEDCLSGLVRSDFALLVVNKSDEKEIKENHWDLPSTCGVEIFKADDIWSGHDPHWDILLDGVRVLERPGSWKGI